jgi:type IV pilus assembly protein PilA
MLNRKKSKNILQKGFTLVELMIVIVIVGVLSAVALPNFLNQTAKAKSTECTSKGGSIMGLVAADALQSKTTGDDSLTALVSEANTNSDLCTFTAGAAVGTGSIYTLTAAGKATTDLAGKYNGAFCVNYETGKKGAATTNTGTAPTAPSC